jgi:CRISPR-associated endonuclease/helicase Cas3
MAVPVVAAGARVLILRNTVGLATATQQAIEALLPANHTALFRVGEILTLHHGRFAAEDRKRLDEAVEERFSKDAPPGHR